MLFIVVVVVGEEEEVDVDIDVEPDLDDLDRLDDRWSSFLSLLVAGGVVVVVRVSVVVAVLADVVHVRF